MLALSPVFWFASWVRAEIGVSLARASAAFLAQREGKVRIDDKVVTARLSSLQCRASTRAQLICACSPDPFSPFPFEIVAPEARVIRTLHVNARCRFGCRELLGRSDVP